MILNGYSHDEGEHLLKKFQSSTTLQRCFCGECSSAIISVGAETPEYDRLRLGTVDNPISKKPAMHIFVADKAEWETI